jgi:DNA-binding transcriptional LysR family regulator
MDIFRNMQIFVEVAREKSFRGAADKLEMPNSTVSRRIAELERDIGLRLFDRSTRHVSLTDAGKLHLDNCEKILDNARLAHEELADLRSAPCGKLSVVANMAPATQWIVPLLPAFSRRYPEISIDLDIASDYPSPLKNGVDVAIVMGPVVQQDLVARQIVELGGLGLYASPSYIEEHGSPDCPAEMGKYQALTHLNVQQWHLVNNGNGKMAIISPNGRIRVANFSALQKLCLAGMGICVWHEFRAQKLVKARQLLRVLPQWSLQPWSFYAVTTSRHIPARVRAFIDFLIQNQPR